MKRKGKLLVFSLALFAIAMYLFICVDWRIAIGVFIYSWSMNIEHKIKED